MSSGRTPSLAFGSDPAGGLPCRAVLWLTSTVTDWGSLTHAYGSADDVPDLLAAAAADADDRAVWDDLWSRLCHQGTVYDASFAALPALTSLTVQRRPAGYVEPLHLAATVVASDDDPEIVDAVRRKYAGELAILRDHAEANLALATGSADFIYGLQALMAFEGTSPWNRELEALSDEELTVDCPSCSESLTICFESLPATITAPDDGSPATAVAPAIPGELRGSTARLHALALRHGRVAVSEAMLSLFGTARCPGCDVGFDLPTALSG